MKKNLKTILEFGVVIVGAIFAFVKLPFIEASNDSIKFNELGAFLTAFILGVTLVIAKKHENKDIANYWLTASIASIVIALGTLWFYQDKNNSCVCQIQNSNLLIGTEFKDPRDAAKDCEVLLSNSSYNSKSIWTESSIKKCRTSLQWLFLALTLLTGISIITLLQALLKVNVEEQINGSNNS